MKIRISPLDALFSRYIRQRSKGYCERCGKYYGWSKLQCCHFHSRRKRSVRWDEENACACCFGDHLYLDGNPLEKVEFFRLRLGQEAFDALNVRAEIIQKPDKELLTLYFKQKLREMGSE